MVNPIIRETLSTTGAAVPTSVTTGAGSKAGDVLVIFQANDWGGIDVVQEPTATGLTFAEIWRGADNGTNGLHSKIFTAELDVDGAKTIDCPNTGAPDTVFFVVVIDGATVADTWLDDIPGTQALQTSSASHVIPSIDSTGEGIYLGWACFNDDGAYSPTPSVLTELAEENSRGYVTGAVFGANIDAAGSIGTQTVTSTVNKSYLTAAVAIKGAADLGNPKLSTLATDFSSMPAFFTANYGTVSIEDGEGHTTTSGYSGFETAKAYSFEDDEVSVKVVQSAGSGASYQTNMMVKANGTGNSAEILQEAGKLIARISTGGSYVDATMADPYDDVAHLYWNIGNYGNTLYFNTSPDGQTYTERHSATHALDFSVAGLALGSGHWNGADPPGVDAIFDDLNSLPAEDPQPTTPPTAADALQQRTLDEFRDWQSWLTDNGATGFIGEWGIVTKWADYGDAAQHALWEGIADVYLEEADVKNVHTAYWSSGREFDDGYPLGMHVGTTQDDPLTIEQSDVLAGHPSRWGLLRAVNLAGYENGVTINGGGTVRSADGFVHTNADFAFLAASGIDCVRLPVAWERIQPTLNAALDSTALTEIGGMIADAANNGISVIFDIHNYGRYTAADGTTVYTLGDAALDADELGDLWTRISTWVQADSTRNATVVAYGIMNEPWGLTGGTATWESVSQAVLTDIRTNGDTRLVFVSGDTFASLFEWRTWHPDGWITDPANNFAYEAHHYWDSGTVNFDGTPSPRSGQFQQPNGAGGHETMSYAYELNLAENPPVPEIHWAADLTQTDLSLMGYENWQTQTDGGTFTNEDTLTPPVVSAPGSRPGDALEIAIDNDTRRNEVVPNHRGLISGDSYYFSQSFYLADGFPLDYNPGAGYDGFQIIDQIHQAWGSHSPPIAFEIVDAQLKLTGGYGLSLDADPEADPTLYQYTQSLGVTIDTEQWYDLVYYVDNFSETAGDSTITVWVDGVEVLTDFVIPPPTLVQGDADGIESYRKHGIYHSTAMPAATLYQAGMAAGTSYAEVDPDDGIVPEEGEGSGSVTSTSSTDETHTTARAGAGEGITSRSSLDSSGDAVKVAESHTQSRTSLSGTGYGVHSGSAQIVSQSQTDGDGRELFGGKVTTHSSTDGTGSGIHSDAGDGLASTVDGNAAFVGIHYGEGEELYSSSSEDVDQTTVRYGEGSISSASTVGGNGLSQQLGSAGIVRPIIGMAIRLVNENGTPGEFLPDWTEIAFTDKYNGTGTVTFTYAKHGVNADLLKGRRVEGALFDGTFEIPGTRFLITQSATDAVREDASGNTVTINAPLWVPSRLSEATIYPVNGVYVPPESGEGDPQPYYKTRFGNASPGNIIGTLLAKAHDRGAVLDIEQTFDSMLDSAGHPWDQQITMEIDPGGSILSVLEKLTELGVCDWKSDGRKLILLNPDSGTDWTQAAKPITLAAGRDMLDAPEKRDAKRVATSILVVGKDGLTVEVEDPAEEARQGARVESYLSVSGVDDRGTLLLIGQKALEAAKLSTESLTHELSLFTDGPIPWVNYTVGDWVYRDVADGNPPQRIRVAQLSCTYAPDGTVKGAATLGTIYESTAQRLQAQIDALTNGSSGIATGPATSPAEDTIPPKAPTGLIVTSDAYQVEGGGTLAAMQADWLPVVENIDGSPVTDLDAYEVSYQVVGTNWWTIAGSPRDAHLVWAPMPTLTSVDVKVRAGDRFGNWSEWSDTVRVQTAEDDTAPLAPSTPTISPYLGTLRVDWDGLNSDSGPMDADLQGTNVEYTDDLDGEWTLVDRISPGGGRAIIAGGLNYGQTYFVRLIAQDWTGNTSDPSGIATGIPQQVINVDIGPDAVDSAQIVDASILRAKIADLAVNDAKIANLDVGKLTAGTMTADVVIGGSFNTSMDPDNRVRMDDSGLRMTYNGQDRVLVEPDGTALFVGEIRTANQGLRLLWNAGGNRASIQFHSNATTDSTAPSLYVAADNVNNSRPAVILDGPEYARTFEGAPLTTGVQLANDYAYFAVRTKNAGDPRTFEGFYLNNAGPVVIRCSGDGGRLRVRNYVDNQYNIMEAYGVQLSNPAFNGEGSGVTYRQSSETTKSEFLNLDGFGIETLRSAPVYTYVADESRNRSRSDGEEIPRSVGIVSEDLPDWMTFPGGDGVKTYSLDALVMLMAQAIRDLDEEMDQYREVKPKRVTEKDKGRCSKSRPKIVNLTERD